MVCFICLKEKQDTFDIFKEDKDDLHVADTIKKHLWFLEDQLKIKANASRICNECWVVIRNFDLYFNQIQEVHQLSKHNPGFDEFFKTEAQLLEDIIKVEPFQFDSTNDSNDGSFTNQDVDLESLATPKSVISLRKSVNKKKKVPSKEFKPAKRSSGKQAKDTESQTKASKIKSTKRTGKEKNETSDELKPDTSNSDQIKAQREETERTIFEFCKPACEFCEIHFTNFKNLRQHYTKEHKMKGFIRCCKRKFYNFSRISVHVQVHMNPTFFQCEICQKTFRSQEAMSRHKRGHNQKTLQCTYAGCSKLYPSAYHLKIHIARIHENKIEKIICDVCNKECQDKLKFRSHFYATHSTEKFVCDLCGRLFQTKGRLKSHRLTHSEVKQLQCPICLHWIKNPSYFKYHMQSHEEADKDHICSHCSKRCKNSRYLKLHIKRIHFTEWSLQCSYCDRKFNRKINLREHIAALHTGEALYTCNFCDKTFNSSANMAVHRKRAHPVEWELHIKTRFTKNSKTA